MDNQRVEREEVYKRAKGRCESCKKYLTYDGFEWHHIYWRSQYKGADRNQERNGACLCKSCHHSIHNGNRDLDKKLKSEADKRKPIEERSKEKVKIYKQKNLKIENDKIKEMKRKMKEQVKEYAKKIKQRELVRYKSLHGGLTPSQVAYREKKQYLTRKKNLSNSLDN